MEEKNIIEKTKEVKEIAKELQEIYMSKIMPCNFSIQNMISFLTLPMSTRFVEDYHINDAMLVNKKVTVPYLHSADSTEEFKYVEWVCEQIEKAKKILKEYQVIVGKIYRYMVDYLIIEDVGEQKEIKKSLADNRTKLKKIMENPIIDIVCEVDNIVCDIVEKYFKTQKLNEKDIGIYTSRYASREYMEEVVNITIKKFPAILQQDISKIYNEYDEFNDIIGYEFEDIEWELGE